MTVDHRRAIAWVLSAVCVWSAAAKPLVAQAGEQVGPRNTATRARVPATNEGARGVLAGPPNVVGSQAQYPAAGNVPNQDYPIRTTAAEESVKQWIDNSHGGADCDCCADPLWCHRNGVFVDFLYLRPGNIDYVYAVEKTGTLPSDSPTGPVGRVGFDGAPGFRVGGAITMSESSSIQATYSWFEDSTHSAIEANGANVLVFQPGDPSIPNVGSSSIAASANYYLRFQQVDLDYRGLVYGNCDGALNYFAGARYASLRQSFSAQEDVGVPVGLTTVNSAINFDGGGIGFGLDGIKRRQNSGLLVYGRASASFVAGEFQANYTQVSQFGPDSVVGNQLVDYRVMTILQTELGVGWQNYCGNLRLLAGYQFAGWFNALTTGTYIPGVQNSQFSNLGETITFDGFFGRVELRF